ncbi:hemerythrin domain-containing protein [Streptomyces lushanensis]|uniref:hemerythrin domain-containing protein n=1 Tax=Streptomyces lushanensis TaxID=1434255 RepID=UPI000830E1E4|nr:hemerythrin domain-containing protein [Streptomyces lushanensis]
MAAPPRLCAGRSCMYDEMLAVHTILRRGTALVSESFGRLAGGEPVDVKVLVNTARWLIESIRRHYASEDVLLWPVLRELVPADAARIGGPGFALEALDAELHELTRTVDAIAAQQVTGEGDAALVVVGQAALSGLPSAQRVQSVLNMHFDEEEAAFKELIPLVPDGEVGRLRSAIVSGAPHTGPHLVFGLMEDPEEVPGYAPLVSNFPAPMRWMRPVLITRYRSSKRALGVPT